MDLLNDSVKNLYFRYLFPSMGSAVVASVYLMTDAVVNRYIVWYWRLGVIQCT